MFFYVCSMWNWWAILQTCGVNLAIQDGVQDGHRFFANQGKNIKSNLEILFTMIKDQKE